MRRFYVLRPLVWRNGRLGIADPGGRRALADVTPEPWRRGACRARTPGDRNRRPATSRQMRFPPATPRRPASKPPIRDASGERVTEHPDRASEGAGRFRRPTTGLAPAEECATLGPAAGERPARKRRTDDESQPAGPLPGHLRLGPPRPGGVLARRGAGARLGGRPAAGLRAGFRPLRPLVSGRHPERLPQCRGPSRRRSAGGSGGDPLRFARHRDQAQHHLPRVARRGGGTGRRPRRPRRRQGRPGDPLHADGARGPVRHAGLRTARRGAFGRVRRLRGQRAGGADRGRGAEGGARRLLRDRAEPRGRLQAAPRRGDRGLAPQAGSLPDPAAPAGRRDAHAGAGPRLGRDRGGRPCGGAAGGLRAGRRHRPALHPLHLRDDREAQGRGPRYRRLPRRPRVVDAEPLRRPARRDLFLRLRHRLGRRALLHRLRAAPARLHHGPVRGQAGGHAGCRRILAGRRRVRGRVPVHRADGAAGHQEGGFRRRPDRRLRPLRLPQPVPRGRARRSRFGRLGRAGAEPAGDRPLVADRDRLADRRQPDGSRPPAGEARQHLRADAGLPGRGAGRGRQTGPGRNHGHHRDPPAPAPAACRRSGARTRACGRATFPRSRATTTPRMPG